GDNTLYPGRHLAVASGATLDLNGTTQTLGIFANPNNTTRLYTGGVVTNSAATAANLVFNNSTSSYFGGVLSGNLSIQKAGGGFQVFSNPQTYTGSTYVSQNILYLQDGGTLASTSGVTANKAEFRIDNAATSSPYNLADRVNDSAPITLSSGFLSFYGRVASVSSETLGVTTLAGGASDISANAPGASGLTTVGYSTVLTLTDLVRSSTDAMLNTRGATGGLGNNAARIIVTSRESNPGLVNNLVGGWAIYGGADFLSYVPGRGLAPLGSTGFAGYDNSGLLAGATAAQNIALGSTQTVAVGGQAINALKFGGSYAVNFANGTDTLNIVSGGIVTASSGTSINNGRLTAGALNATGLQNLYIHANSQNLALNATIVDNSANAPVRLVTAFYNNSGGVTMTAPNTYTGGTVFQGWGTDAATHGATLNGSAGVVVIPAGGLTITNTNVTMTNSAGQIDPSNVVTINGGATLSLFGSNTLAKLVFNNDGGARTPFINTSGLLTLPTSANPVIVAGGSLFGTVPDLRGQVDLGGSTATIQVDPYTFNGVAFAPWSSIPLNISGNLANATAITKTGAGMLQLSGRNKITGAFNLNAGGLLLSNAATANPGVQSLLRLDQPLVLSVATASGGASGQSVINTTATNGLIVGMEISGIGIPAGTVITAVAANSSFTISSPLNSTATGAYVGVGSSYQGSLGFAALNVANGTFLSAAQSTADFANQLNVNGSFALQDLGRINFNGNIALAADATISVPAPQALLVFRGGVSGTGVVTKDGAGTLWFGNDTGFASPTGWG
ncbi:MAG: hypothetical protein EBR62_07970, partial [Verrucomicrobia bacterium]|nr:hypothetical protein [Verrucomicrobiota bacterium]